MLAKLNIKLCKRLSAVCLIGSAAFLPFTASADVSVKTWKADAYVRYIQASHFLSQATFGPTVESVTALANRIKVKGRDDAFNEWIDQQFAIDDYLSSQEKAAKMLDLDGVEAETYNSEDENLLQNTRYYREHVWWHQNVLDESQLRNRMTWALYQIMPAYGSDTRIGWWSNLGYEDLLKENAFATHRDLLEDVTYSPKMATFLSSIRNDKGDESAGIYPDENFAREIMQLFSVGVYKYNSNARLVTDDDGNRIENYTIDDISQVARVFTGLSYDKARRNQTFYSSNALGEDGRLVMWDDHHHQGKKSFLGSNIPAGQTGDQDISDTLDILVNYSSTPYYFSNALIQRFTSSTPNINYLKRVADVYIDNGQGIRGDFKEVIRAILMDTTVRDSLKIEKTTDTSDSTKTLITVDVNQDLWENTTAQGRLREPMLQMANFFRFFEVDAKEHETNIRPGDFKPFWSEVAIGQSIRTKISIFGYYNADYLPVDGPASGVLRNGRPLVLPEFELLPSALIRLNENITDMAKSQDVKQAQTITSEYSTLPRLAGYLEDDDFSRLIEELNVFLFGGTMADELQDELLEILNSKGQVNSALLKKAIAVLLSSPDFAIVN